MLRVFAVRLGWAAVVGALFLGRDMCLGGGKRPTPPVDPTDSRDSSLDLGASAPGRAALVQSRSVVHG
ncbi:MAG: hypothetical protein IPF92_22315 [Myxococcales bacterium]|nr:hypothetical protein [Myxococcales bacterium]MBL0194577.1 hypothetical protein [Myxococcales bacterium]HQY63308.1 hypothetical protein [Polyangiaceae bacterium]